MIRSQIFRSRRSRWLLAAAALALSVGVTSCAAAISASPALVSSDTTLAPTAARPNIVFVLTDDLSSNLVQYMPHVQALQKSGTTFTNYSVTDSLCCPSRSSIFTGRFPHNTGVFTNSAPDGGFGVFHSRGEESATFATALQGAGYRTAMMGKYLNGYMATDKLGGAKPYVPPGWTEWDVTDNGYPEYNYDLNHNGQIIHHGSAPEDYLTRVDGVNGSAFIKGSAAANKPFMLEIATFAPHAPYTPAPQDVNKFPGLQAPRGPSYDTLPTNAPSWLASRPPLTDQEKATIDTGFRKRVQAVQSVDRMIETLQGALTPAQAANTVIVFSSDNGYHMGQYRLNPGKMTAFDTDINVPLVVSGPGVAAGAVRTEPVENIDLAPTFETLGGAFVSKDVDGRAIVSLLAGKPAPDWRTTSLVEHHGPDNDPADPDLPEAGSGNPPTYNALRTATFTYVRYAGGEIEYYDRGTDPLELHNTAGSLSPNRVSSLNAALAALTRCTGQDACWAAGHQAG